MRRIVLTGAPGSGKTTICGRIALSSLPVLCTPEVPTIFLDGGLKHASWLRITSASLNDAFVEQILSARSALEATFQSVASLAGLKGVVSDRGLADAAAYLGANFRLEYRRLFRRSLEEDCASYDAVIHLAFPEGLPERARKPTDPTDPQARALDGFLADVWSTHRNYFRVSPTRTVDEKAQTVLEIIEGVL